MLPGGWMAWIKCSDAILPDGCVMYDAWKWLETLCTHLGQNIWNSLYNCPCPSKIFYFSLKLFLILS